MMRFEFLVRGLFFCFACCLGFSALVFADGPADNHPKTVRPVPPPGIKLSPETHQTIQAQIDGLFKELVQATDADSLNRDLCEAIPRAVQMTLDTGMFYSDKEVASAQKLLQLGKQRIEMLASGADPLKILGIPVVDQSQPLREPLLVAGGFRSKLDDSVQPYGLVLPAGWTASSDKRLRLDVWLHGRGEKVSEAAFLDERSSQVGQYAPRDTIVLHPYGRYCNAFKFAGEIDVLEAIEHVRKILPIDEQRITIRGFSMGGAGCWQLAVHYPNLWAAANPGAGFSETTEFLRQFQSETIKPTDYQAKLLQWYDCPGWTNNLRNVPTIAYSGEVDRQKQAADMMSDAFEERGMNLPHIIGAGMGHKIDEPSKQTIEMFLSEVLVSGKPSNPAKVDLTTYTLRYNKLAWLTIEGLEQHWSESRVQGILPESGETPAIVRLLTSGVNRLSIQLPEQLEANGLDVDGQVIELSEQVSHITVSKNLANGSWSLATSTTPAFPGNKRPGLQGPIDDAFMERFIFVPPKESTGGIQSSTSTWATSEFVHAIAEWKRHFRGNSRIHRDELGNPSEQENWILFGTPSTNPLLAEVTKHLPIEWTDQELVVNGVRYPAATHAPVLIYPNPLSPDKYIVINSGTTYREYAYLNNARQVPMLPDWAVVDVTQPADTQYPGKIVDAGFFDEQWQFAK